MTRTPQEQQLGRFRLLEQIASGNAGIVYRSYDNERQCDVAIKLAAPRNTQNIETLEHYRKLFAREARVAGMLQHPNILQVYEAHLDGAQQYLVMEYIAGRQTLADHCQPDKLLPVSQVIELVAHCADALDYAHSHGVIHKDVKPANILLTESGGVKLADFSLAHIEKPDLAQTAPSGFMGSPRYMSPEQFHEDQISHQTDIYSLGVVLYELLTGRHPFETDILSRLVYRVLNDDPPALQSVRADLPPSLQTVITRALQKTLKRRFQTAREMVLALTGAALPAEADSQDQVLASRHAQLSELTFFRDFGVAAIWEVLRTAHWQTYVQGEHIPLDAKDSDAFYLLVTGEVELAREDRPSRRLVTGACFGEFACATPEARQALHINTQTPAEVLRLDSDSFQHLSAECRQSIDRALLRTLVDMGTQSRASAD